MRIVKLYRPALLALSLVLAACGGTPTSGDQEGELSLPPYLGWVFPEVGRTVTLDDFRRGYVFGGIDNTTQDFEIHLQVPSAVCVTLDATPVLEAGDNGLSRDDYVSRSRLILDGLSWERNAPIVVMEFAGALDEVERDPETGESSVVRRNATGPFTICWETELDRGSHSSQFQIAKSSGEQLSFEWIFTIGA